MAHRGNLMMLGLEPPTPDAPLHSPPSPGAEKCPADLPPGFQGAAGPRVCPGAVTVRAYLYVLVLPLH